MTLPIPNSVLYAGLAGVLISLIVATAQQRWQFRVFALLVLRIAIGWHFLFEGLHKIHSHHIGPTETNRVFTSEPYFQAAEGPLGEYMRKRFLGDPEIQYKLKTEQLKPLSASEFSNLPRAEQAALCPPFVSSKISKALKFTNGDQEALATQDKSKELEAQIKDLTPKLDAAKKNQDTEAEKNLTAQINDLSSQLAQNIRMVRRNNNAEMLRAEYAGWVYDVTKRPVTFNMITNEGNLSAPKRVSYITMLDDEYKRLSSERGNGLGRGDTKDMDRMKTIRTELLAAKNELSQDCDKYVGELLDSAGLNPGPAEVNQELKNLDFATRWGITAIGAGLIFGFLTRFWCVAGIGFLVMTYLTHPTVPWLSLPPMTEGNPLFINKNLIEAFGLLVVLAHPTGRWLGLDALFYWLWYSIRGNKSAG